MTSRRLLLVHAHPDDESIATGGTMAKYVAEGAQVTLVTCTAGEEGEVLVPALEHLAADRDDALAPQRREELAAAMAELGVTDHRFLGGFGRYRDSGMQWGPDGHAMALDTTRPGTFWGSDLLDPANDLVEIIREVRPQVVVTYDEFGGYGHPDHVQAHRVTHYAVTLASARSYRKDLGQAWSVSRIFWTAMSARAMREGLKQLRESGDTTTFEGMEPESLPPSASEDDDLDAAIDASAHYEAKMAALRAYETQIAVDGPFFALSNNIGVRAWGTEHYRLASGVPMSGEGLGDDLFEGLGEGR